MEDIFLKSIKLRNNIKRFAQWNIMSSAKNEIMNYLFCWVFYGNTGFHPSEFMKTWKTVKERCSEFENNVHKKETLLWCLRAK